MWSTHRWQLFLFFRPKVKSRQQLQGNCSLKVGFAKSITSPAKAVPDLQIALLVGVIITNGPALLYPRDEAGQHPRNHPGETKAFRDQIRRPWDSQRSYGFQATVSEESKRTDIHVMHGLQIVRWEASSWWMYVGLLADI